MAGNTDVYTYMRIYIHVQIMYMYVQYCAVSRTRRIWSVDDDVLRGAQCLVSHSQRSPIVWVVSCARPAKLVCCWRYNLPYQPNFLPPTKQHHQPFTPSTTRIDSLINITPPIPYSKPSYKLPGMAEEGAAVPPQAKGSWSSFLKVNIHIQHRLSRLITL